MVVSPSWVLRRIHKHTFNMYTQIRHIYIYKHRFCTQKTKGGVYGINALRSVSKRFKVYGGLLKIQRPGDNGLSV